MACCRDLDRGVAGWVHPECGLTWVLLGFKRGLLGTVQQTENRSQRGVEGELALGVWCFSSVVFARFSFRLPSSVKPSEFCTGIPGLPATRLLRRGCREAGRVHQSPWR